MELVALGILAAAAFGGMALTAIRLSGKPFPPTWIAMGHGAIAATGVGVLGYLVFLDQVPVLSQIALGVFLIAAIGGAILFARFHLREEALPIPLILGHGLIALLGLVILVVSTYRVVVL